MVSNNDCGVCPQFDINVVSEPLTNQINIQDYKNPCERLNDSMESIISDINRKMQTQSVIMTLSYSFWYEYLLSYCIKQSIKYNDDISGIDFSYFIAKSDDIQSFITKYIGADINITIKQGAPTIETIIPSKIYDDRIKVMELDSGITSNINAFYNLINDNVNITHIKKEQQIPQDFLGINIFWEPIQDPQTFAKSGGNLQSIISDRLNILLNRIDQIISDDTTIRLFFKYIIGNSTNWANKIYDIGNKLISNWIGMKSNTDILSDVTSEINNRISELKNNDPELANCLPDKVEPTIPQADDIPLNEYDTLTNPDTIYDNKWIGMLCYWQKFFAIVNMLSLLPIVDSNSKTGFRYWAYGIILPNGVKIPVPTVFMPLIVYMTPSGINVSVLAVTGMDIRLLTFAIDSCGRIKLLFGGNTTFNWVGLFSLFAPEIIFKINDDIKPIQAGIEVSSTIASLCDNFIKYTMNIFGFVLSDIYRDAIQDVIKQANTQNYYGAMNTLKSIFEQVINVSKPQLIEYMKRLIYSQLDINGITDISPIAKIKPVLTLSQSLADLSISSQVLPQLVLQLREKIDVSKIKSVFGIANFPAIIYKVNVQNVIANVKRAILSEIIRQIQSSVYDYINFIDTTQALSQMSLAITNTINPFSCMNVFDLNNIDIPKVPIDFSPLYNLIESIPDDVFVDLMFENNNMFVINNDYDLIDMLLYTTYKILSTTNISLPSMQIDFVIPVMSVLSTIEQMALGLQKTIVLSTLSANKLIINRLLDMVTEPIIQSFNKMLISDKLLDDMVRFITSNTPDLDSFIIRLQSNIQNSNPCFMFEPIQSLFLQLKSQFGGNIITDLNSKLLLLDGIRQTIKQNKGELRHSVSISPMTIVQNIMTSGGISHPILLSDQLPSYSRLNINNVLFVQHIDSVLKNNPNVVGF